MGFAGGGGEGGGGVGGGKGGGVGGSLGGGCGGGSGGGGGLGEMHGGGGGGAKGTMRGGSPGDGDGGGVGAGLGGDDGGGYGGGGQALPLDPSLATGGDGGGEELLDTALETEVVEVMVEELARLEPGIERQRESERIELAVRNQVAGVLDVTVSEATGKVTIEASMLPWIRSNGATAAGGGDDDVCTRLNVEVGHGGEACGGGVRRCVGKEKRAEVREVLRISREAPRVLWVALRLLHYRDLGCGRSAARAAK